MDLIEQKGVLHAPLINGNARTYELVPYNYRILAKIYPKAVKSLVVSFYSAVRSGSEDVRIQLKGPYSSQTYDFRVTDVWERYEFVLESGIGLAPLDVAIQSVNPIRKSIEIGFLLLQIEKGKIASSTINGDILLPVIGKKNSPPGPSRSADSLALKHETNSLSSTHIIVFSSTAETWQYEDDQFLVFWRFKDTKADFEMCFGISGLHGARFAARVKDRGKTDWYPSRHIAGKQEYAASVVFDHGNAALSIDGFEIVHLQVSPKLNFDTVSNTADDASGPGMTIALVLSYAVPLSFFGIVSLLNRHYPEVVHAAHNLVSKHLIYSISGDDENVVYNRVQKEEGFHALLRELRFALPKVLEQFPPGSSFKEEDIRDWVYALISRPQTNLAREAYSKTGRTDLVLSYTADAGVSPKAYHVEFKIWGRPGYKSLPKQPIKYQAPADHFSAVVLIDRRKSANLKDFDMIVSRCKDYPFVSTARVPLLEAGLNYFVSFHMDPNSSFLRMVLNIHLSIPE